MRTRIPGIMRLVGSTPWAIVPDKLNAILDVLELRAAGVEKSDDEIQAVVAARRATTVAPSGSKIAVLPLFGTIAQRANMMSEYSGGTSCEQFGASFDAAMANSDVGSIVIDCDSPGGSVNGVPELAAKIRAARGTGKKIVAVANSLMASAAYWICAQADEIVVTPSGDVGSIGVFMCHTDWSAMDAADGVTRTLISAGKYKTEGNPYEPLSDDARAALQASVDEFYAMFTADVAAGRGVKVSAVENGYGEGRVLTASQAVKAGLADRIATLDEVLADLGASGATGRTRRASAPSLQRAAALVFDEPGTFTAQALEELRGLGLLRSANTDHTTLITVQAGGTAGTGSIPPASHRPNKAKEHTVPDNNTAAHGADPAAIQAAVDAALAKRDASNQQILALCSEHGLSAAQQVDVVSKSNGDLNAAATHVLNAKKQAAPAGAVITMGADREAERPFKSFGEQMVAAVQAGIPGRRVDPRLVRVNQQMFAGSPSGMNESVGSEGGFFIQPDLLPGVIDPIYAEDPILSRVTRIPIGAQSSGVKYNVVDETARTTGSRWGGVQMVWGAEADLLGSSKPKLRQMVLDLKKLIGAAYLTDELMQDAPAAESLLGRAFQAETGFMLAAAVYAGTGAGQPLGIKNSGALISQAIEAAQTIANSAASLALNTSKMMSRIPASLWGEIIWLYNQELLPYLQVATLGGTSVGAFTAAGGATGKPFDTIWGRPAYASELCEAVGTPGDILCVVPSQYHMADKGGPLQAQSIHVRFLYDEMTLRWTYRADGAPVWKQSVTPFKGANARSPFVALATRA